MPLAQARHERLTKRVALAVFSSDALSSVAYATEEILLVLSSPARPRAPHRPDRAAHHGAAGRSWRSRTARPSTPIRSGGGSYIVAKDNLGTVPGAHRRGGAAGRLRADRLGVSRRPGSRRSPPRCPARLAQGRAQRRCAWSASRSANLRGVRESGRIFAVPTYFFIASFGLLGRGRRLSAATGTCRRRRRPPIAATEALTWFLCSRALRRRAARR